MPVDSRAFVVVAAVSALLASGCGDTVNRQRTLALAECRLPHLPTAAQCGVLEVPEDRTKPDGRKLTIFTAVLPANTATPAADPLLIIAGGPGQAASRLAPFATRLNELRRTRDIVLVDQRGTGRSSPLTCAALRPRPDDAFETDPVPRARECIEELQRAGVDAAQYTTTAWLADLEAVREALGYRQWNLWGGSYGTRVAQEYLRRHPDRVRTVTLDGVAPPGMTISLDIWRTRDAALNSVLRACADQAACRGALPDPATALQRIGDALGPDGRMIEYVDPRTGARKTERVTVDAVLAALQPLTYAPETTSLLPQLLALAERGDYGPLIATYEALAGDLSEQMNTALHFSVTCAEDVPRIKPGDDKQALEALPTRNVARNVIAVCNMWPRGAMPADFTEPVTTSTPVLILSGGMDPVTPPAYGADVAKGFATSKHIVAPGYGHIVSPHACAPRLIAAFVEHAGFTKLPESCVDYFAKTRPPPLWSSLLAPAP